MAIDVSAGLVARSEEGMLVLETWSAEIFYGWWPP